VDGIFAMKRYLLKFQCLFLRLVVFNLFFLSAFATVHARSMIIITYDISGSMFTINNEQTQYFLSSGEFESLAETIVYLIFDGDPSQNLELTGLRNGAFLSNITIITDIANVPFWKEGDNIELYLYAEKIDSVFSSKSNPTLTKNELRKKIFAAMPFPRGISSESRYRDIPGVRSAFKKAFPGIASLHDIAELQAYKAFDEMVRRGDNEPQVIWIKISDEDMDTTEDILYKNFADRLREDLITYKERIYRDCKPKVLYQVKVGDRVWVSAFNIILPKTADLSKIYSSSKALEQQLKERQQKLEQEQAILQEENERLRRELDERSLCLNLSVAGEVITGNQVSKRVVFERKKVGSSSKESGEANKYAFATDTIRFIAGNGTSSSDFRIQEVQLEVCDKNHYPLSQYKYSIGGNVRIGDPIQIDMPDDDDLRQNGRIGSLTVKYLYKPTGSDVISKTKSWQFSDLRFPERGLLARFPWLVFVFIILGIGLIWFFLGRTKQDGEGVPAIPVVGSTDPLNGRISGGDEFEEGHDSTWRKPDAPGTGDTSDSAKQHNSRLLMLMQDESNRFELTEGKPVSLSEDDRSIGGDVWELDCPGHHLELKGAALYHNGKLIEIESIIGIKNRSGIEITIQVQ
jgi:hypothetical protein